MFKDIGDFLHKNVVAPVDRYVVKPIDKAIVEPIKTATDKDYALRHETARVAKLENRNAHLRPVFFQAQQDFAAARADYERASEDFSDAHGALSLSRLRGGGPGIMTQIDPRAQMPEALKVMDDASRFVLKTVSLGLSEALYNIEEIPRARAALQKRIKHLEKESAAMTRATQTLADARERYEAATVAIRAEHARLGADATQSDVHVMSARAAAQKEIIQRLLADGIDPETIAGMTGIAPEIIAEVSRLSAPRKEPS